MKSDENKRALIQYLCDANKTNPQLQLIEEDCIYDHEEANVNIISYLLKMLSEKRYIEILADDTDIFIPLVLCLALQACCAGFPEEIFRKIN